MASRGQAVLVQCSTGRYHPAWVINVNSGDNVNLMAFSDEDTWDDGTNAGGSGFTHFIDSVDKGTGVGQWQESPTSLSSPTISTPTRAIGTAFQPSTVRPTLVIYSVRVVSGLTLTTGAAGRFEFRSDASNPPTTVRARVAGGATGTLVIGANTSDTAEGSLVFVVKPGDYGLIQTVSEVGTPTYSITAQLEVTL